MDCCGNLSAHHALLMSRYTPKLTPLSTKGHQWLVDDAPIRFTGTVYSNGSTTTINHACPQTQRAGFRAVIITDEQYDFDHHSLDDRDDNYYAENQPEPNGCDQRQICIRSPTRCRTYDEKTPSKHETHIDEATQPGTQCQQMARNCLR